MRATSLENAVIEVFQSQPDKVFTIQEIYDRIEDYYDLSDYQKELDPKYPQPRYCHEVRSIVARLERLGVVKKIARDQRKLSEGGLEVYKGPLKRK